MRFWQTAAGLAVSLGWAAAQSTTQTREIFIINDNQHARWCAYKNKAESRSESQRMDSTVVAGVQYGSDGRVATVHITQGDESGDWSVDDRYSLDKSGNITALSRVIDSFTLGVTEEERFRIYKGKATRVSIVSRASRTGQSAQPLTGDYLPDVPVITNVESFSFWPIVRDKRNEVWSKARVCVPKTGVPN
jgi:hypothetical protein